MFPLTILRKRKTNNSEISSAPNHNFFSVTFNYSIDIIKLYLHVDL